MKHFLFAMLLVPMILAAAPAVADNEAAPRGWLNHHKHPHGPLSDTKAAPARKDGTAVYGWSSRGPASRNSRAAFGDCGAYHYWDGNRCADARDNPPPM
jgi:hypothetical protein